MPTFIDNPIFKHSDGTNENLAVKPALCQIIHNTGAQKLYINFLLFLTYEEGLSLRSSYSVSKALEFHFNHCKSLPSGTDKYVPVLHSYVKSYSGEPFAGTIDSIEFSTTSIAYSFKTSTSMNVKHSIDLSSNPSYNFLIFPI